MKFYQGLMIALLGITLFGCSSTQSGLVGTGAGVLATGAGYEYKANQEMKKLDADLAGGRITQNEYNIRRDQIAKGSILQ